MNLISCNNCGVVLDKDKLKFPDEDEVEFQLQEGNDKVAEWNGDKYVALTPCPVCKEGVPEHD